jgi:hypothetical protein
MAVEIQMYGIEQVQNLFLELPKNMDIEIDKAQERFMTMTTKIARVYAPKFSGQLAESITWDRKKKGIFKLTVASPYGFFQEYGFTGRFLLGTMPVQGGYRIIDWLEAKGLNEFGFKPTGQPHPFVEPALEIGLSNLPMMLNEATYKAVMDSLK